MTRRAIVVDDRGDVLVERHRSFRRTLRGKRQRDEQGRRKTNPPATAETSLMGCHIHCIRHPTAFVSDFFTGLPLAMASSASRKSCSVATARFLPSAA